MFELNAFIKLVNVAQKYNINKEKNKYEIDCVRTCPNYGPILRSGQSLSSMMHILYFFYSSRRQGFQQQLRARLLSCRKLLKSDTTSQQIVSCWHVKPAGSRNYAVREQLVHHFPAINHGQKCGGHHAVASLSGQIRQR